MAASEKQIKWANEIIMDTMKNAVETKKTVEDGRDERIEKALNIGKSERIQRIHETTDDLISEINEVIYYLKKANRVNDIINLRGSFEKSKSGKSARWRMIAADVAMTAGVFL